MKGTSTTQSGRKATGSTEHSNQTMPNERTAIKSAPEPRDNDLRNVIIDATTILLIPIIPTNPLPHSLLRRVDRPARLRYAFQFARGGNSLPAPTRPPVHNPHPKPNKPPHPQNN